MWVLRDQIPDNDSTEEWKSSPFTSEISGEEKRLFHLFLESRKRCFVALWGSSHRYFLFSFSFEFFTVREGRSTNILYKTVFASETLEILSAVQLSQVNSLKYALPLARCEDAWKFNLYSMYSTKMCHSTGGLKNAHRAHVVMTNISTPPHILTQTRIRTGGGLSWMRQWNSGFHKRRTISWLALQGLS